MLFFFLHFDLKVTSLPDKNECGNVFQNNRRRLVCLKPAGGLEAPLLPSLNSHPRSHGPGSLMNDERRAVRNTAPAAHTISPVYVASC